MNNTPLGNLVDIQGGGTPSRNDASLWNGGIPWATVKDFKSTLLSSTKEFISQKGVEKSATSVIPAGTIVLPTRMAVGKAAVTAVEMAINQDLKALHIKDTRSVDRDYLLRCILWKGSELERSAKGATVKGITLDILRSLEIPVPLLSKQKQIAAILNKADSIIRKRQKSIELADQFLLSVFQDMFGDPQENPFRFPVGSIRDLVDSVNYGTSAKADPESGEYPILRMGNITYAGHMDYTDLKYIDLAEKDKTKYLVRKGDLLFNRTNSKELVGKTAVYDRDDPMAIAGYLIRVRANSKGNPYYLSGYLNSGHGKQTLQNMCKSIVGMANINAQELQDMRILMPPTSLQERFESIVMAVKAKTRLMIEAEKQANDLFNALSQKAFNGEL